MRDLLQFILNSYLKFGDLILQVRVFNALTYFQSLLVHVCFKQSLSMIELVFWVEFRELFIALGCGGKVLNIVVTVS